MSQSDKNYKFSCDNSFLQGKDRNKSIEFLDKYKVKICEVSSWIKSLPEGTCITKLNNYTISSGANIFFGNF